MTGKLLAMKVEFKGIFCHRKALFKRNHNLILSGQQGQKFYESDTIFIGNCWCIVHHMHIRNARLFWETIFWWFKIIFCLINCKYVILLYLNKNILKLCHLCLLFISCAGHFWQYNTNWREQVTNYNFNELTNFFSSTPVLDTNFFRY